MPHIHEQNLKDQLEPAGKQFVNLGKTLARFENKLMNEHNIPIKGFLTGDTATALYNKIYDTCLCENFPLPLLVELAIHRSCIPNTHLDERFIEAIGHSICWQILNIIPATNVEMLELLSHLNKAEIVIKPYGQSFDKHAHSWDQLTKGWVPEWKNDTSPSKYATDLQSYVSEFFLSQQLYQHPTIKRNDISSGTVLLPANYDKTQH